MRTLTESTLPRFALRRLAASTFPLGALGRGRSSRSVEEVALRALRDAGLSGDLLPRLLEEAQYIEIERASRSQRRARARLGFVPAEVAFRLRHPPRHPGRHREPMGIFRSTTAPEVARNIACHYSLPPIHEIRILHAAPGAPAALLQERVLRRGRFEAPRTRITLALPADWVHSVRHRGLFVVTGLLTVEARKDPDSERILPEGEIFRARWIEQSTGTVAGYRLRIVSGYIARLHSIVAHGSTMERAVARLARSLRLTLEEIRLPLQAIGERVLEVAGREILAEDVVSSGACWSGVRGWCYSVDLEAALDRVPPRAPIEEVWRRYARSPRAEVRAAVLRALRAPAGEVSE